MSQLNLTVDPLVLGVQAAVFLANLYVVKKLMLNPYLKVRAAREARTGGSQQDAQALQNDTIALEAIITNKMREAHKEASITREKIKASANQERSSLLNNAEAEAKKSQLKFQQEISQNLNQERSQKAEAIETAAQLLFEQAVK